MNITFRKAAHDDWTILLKLEKSEIGNIIYAPETDMAEFKKFFSHSVLYLIFVDTKLAGYCGYEQRPEESEIMGLLILKPFRNKGIGEESLKKCLNDLRAAGKIKISTNPKNSIALLLYQKYGFKITELKDNYWHGQSRVILYRKND